MKVDFFKNLCQRVVKDSRFGLCDDDNKQPAYPAIINEDKWIATVINNNGEKIIFTAIDNCIEILRADGEMDNRCDVMLNYESNLFFVELKNKRKEWKSEGLKQIEATIKRMIEENHQSYYKFKKRRAIVANSKHRFPAFEQYDSEQREYFKEKYNIRIQFESDIIIN